MSSPVSSDTPVPALSVSGLVKRYGAAAPAVDHVSFSVAKGEFFAFLGPNGAGKTTTISSIVGLVTPQEGAIRLFGKDVHADFRAARRLVGLAPQEYNFDRYLTIEEILLYQAGYFGIPLHEARPRAKALLTQFGLWEKRGQDFLKLSGGMKRRLSLARALIHKPQILILDEPTAGVDLELRLELWSFLSALNREGMTIMLTTHYLEEAEALCSRVGIIHQGKLVALDDTATLLAGGLGGDAYELTLATPVSPELPASFEGVTYEIAEEGRVLRLPGLPASELPRLLKSLEVRGYALKDLSVRKKTLQERFLELTKTEA